MNRKKWRYWGLCLIALLMGQKALAQTQELKEIKVFAFERQKSWRRSSDAISSIDSVRLQQNNGWQLWSTLNTQAGVRMEERSPGSYRVAIRGSALRAPFGVRNVKMYWNQLPISDAGNNTYFQLFEPDLFQDIQILKGPNGGFYGPGTGGTMLLSSQIPTQTQQKWNSSANGLGGWRQALDLQWKQAQHRHRLFLGYTKQPGYRDQSDMERAMINYQFRKEWTQQRYLELLSYYGDMYYQTPGGLTLKQYQENPRAARPAAGAFKSAQQQQAAFYLKSFYLGALVGGQWNARWAWKWGNAFQFNQIRNPSIRNYEVREEPNLSTRLVLQYQVPLERGLFALDYGLEWQQGNFRSSTFGNVFGKKDSLQYQQDTRLQQWLAFVQAEVQQGPWTFTVSGSWNQQRAQGRAAEGIPAPRLGINFKLDAHQSLYLKSARGFSPPSIAELRPSALVFNQNLRAEKGWLNELAYRFQTIDQRFRLQLTAYQMNLKESIVLRRDAAGADYFVNMGKIRQKGLELDWTWKWGKTMIQGASTWQDFRFVDYTSINKSYAGNRLTGTAPFTQSLNFMAAMGKHWVLSPQWLHSAEMFLNDANTDRLPTSDWMSLRLNYQGQHKNWSYVIWSSLDNALNQTMSLGPDLNALGGRYYNAANGRLWSLGMNWTRR